MAKTSNKQPKLRSVAQFFRTLATMHSAGISLHRALDHLSTSHSGEPIGEVSQMIHADLVSGHRFSASLKRHPRVFGRFVVTMVKVGEKSGKLDRVLERLSDHMEWEWSSKTKLKSALTYPGFSLGLCLIMVVVAPSYLLRGQLEMLRTSGVELPLITKALIGLSDLLHSPIFVILLVLLFFAFGWGVRWIFENPRTRKHATVFLSAVPVLGELIRLHALARFTRAFSFLLDAGVNVSEAIPLAFESTGNAILELEGSKAVQKLMGGETLGDALCHHSYSDSMFELSVEAGEQTGSVSTTMAWLSNLYAQNAEANQERLATLLEPALMVITGICVGLLLVATLTPTISLLESI